MTLDQKINQYFEQIQILLPTFSKSTGKYLKDLKNSVEDYCQKNPDISMEDIINTFGSPQDIVCNYIDCMDTEQLIQQISINKLVKRAVIILIFLVTIGCMVFSITTYRAYLDSKNTVITSEETIIE